MVCMWCDLDAHIKEEDKHRFPGVEDKHRFVSADFKAGYIAAILEG